MIYWNISFESEVFMTTPTSKKKSGESLMPGDISVAKALVQNEKRVEKANRTGATIRIKGAERSFFDFKKTVIHVGSVERINRIRKGIDAAHIIHVSDYFKVSREEIGSIIGISTSTMNRKLKSNAILSPSESERLERIAEIEAEAEDVFGDAEMARRWLLKNNFALGSTPLSMLDTDIGTGEVRKILSSIAYGGVV